MIFSHAGFPDGAKDVAAREDIEKNLWYLVLANLETNEILQLYNNVRSLLHVRYFYIVKKIRAGAP